MILVTGGAAGIGAGVVRTLLSENARHVAFLDIGEREGASLEQELMNKFGALRAKYIKCDVSNQEQLSAAYKQVLEKYRRLDVVINCAAVLSADEKCYKRMIDVNFAGTVHSTLKALEVMGLDKGGFGGTVVNLSSMLALHFGTLHLPVYAATKTAVLQFSICMGTEAAYKKSGVRILTVCLGPTDTAILQRNNSDNFDKAIQQLTSRVTQRQRVESAVNGIIAVISQGASGTTWIVENDKPAYDFTEDIATAFQTLSYC